jgi:predicted metalloprotease with PDZ domain
MQSHHRGPAVLKATLMAVAAVAAAAPLAAHGSEGPQPIQPPAAIAAPRDVAYPGTLQLRVDATDLDRRIIRVRETVPLAAAGPITLLYPQWLPGNHSPSGPLDKLAGLTITVDGQPVAWTRDPLDVFAFHVTPPAGARALELEFQFVSPTTGDQGRVVVTQEMLNLQWNALALYPAGYFTRRIMVETSARLPTGWGYGTALEAAGTDAGVVRFKPVDFETLVDSPMFAGRYFRRVDLDPGGRSPVKLDIVADRQELLDATPQQLEAHRELVRQADRLYGARHFDHYDFLLALTDTMGAIGLEHHRSSEDGTSPGYFVSWEDGASNRDLLPHEFTHSWNGKYRRPADLWTPNFNVPMGDSLLWVYEGQTQYWGFVLAARSGLLSRQEALDALAVTAALYDNRVGRAWRNVADTTLDPIITERRPIPWTSWQRSEDYYSEGQLIWLDADTLIREQSGGRKSLDDFAHAFFGGKDGDWSTVTYTFDDVVAALNAVQPYDWASFLRARLETTGGKAPLDGLARGGYRLTYSDTPTAYFKASEGRRKITDLTYSLGLVLNREGEITGVQWDGPAFRAGLAVGGRILAVNGIVYEAGRLKDAVTEAKGGGALDLLVKTGEHFRTFTIEYKGGLRYPHLERIPGASPRLDAIFTARK